MSLSIATAHAPNGRYRSYMLTLVTVVYAFNFTDRNVLALLMQPIKTDLGLTDTQMGLLSGIAFALFYSVLGIPIARWADRGNRASIISLTTALWSAMVVLCAFAGSYLQLLMARIGVAVGEAGCVPPAQSLIADHYSREERPRAMGLYMLGAPLSVIVGYALAGWINERYGWRAAFLAVGAPGVVLALLAKLTLREPGLARERRDIPLNVPVEGYIAVFRTLWSRAAYRHLMLSFTLIYLFAYGIAQWMPAFFIRTHHVQTAELGFWYALWGVGAIAGTYVGGALASRYAAGNEQRQLKAMAIALIGFIPLYVIIYLAESLPLIFVLMMVSAFIYCSIFGPLFATVQEVVAPEMRAMSVAIVLLFANLIGMGLGPMAVGGLSDLLAPWCGEASLRIALLAWTPGYLWAAFHLLRARRHV